MKFSLAVILLTGTAAWAVDPVPMDVKTGQWETTETSQMSGIPLGAIPAEQLSKLSPDQRSKLEAAMNKSGNRTITIKGCIKKEDLVKLNLNEQTRACKRTLVRSSRTKQEVRMDCDLNGLKETGTVVVEALNSESMKFNVQMAGTSNGQPVNVNVTGTSKWIGATCDDTK